MYIIKAKNDKVTFLMQSGEDYVTNTMDKATAEQMINEAKNIEKMDDTRIKVDDKFIFEIVPEKKTASDKKSAPKKKG